MLTDLKPCPFCGAQPEDPDVGDYFVECPRCGVQGPITNKDGQPHAKEEWNRRAIEAEVLQAQEPVGYANGDELDNLLDDRSITIAARPNGFQRTPIFTAPQPPAPCQCPDPEQIIALQHAADTAEAQALDNEKLRADVERLTKELSDCKVIMNMACTDNEKAQAERIAAQSAALAKAREALEAAKAFIHNGVALGFIRMPDADTPDPAHQTPLKINAALAAIAAQKGGA